MPNSRIRQIMTLLMEEKRVVAKELAARFGVSDESIRRDLSELERQGVVRKIYGGAVLVEEHAPAEEAALFEHMNDTLSANGPSGAGFAVQDKAYWSLQSYKQSIPEEKTEEAIVFVSRFDYPTLAKQTIDSMLARLDSGIEQA